MSEPSASASANSTPSPSISVIIPFLNNRDEVRSIVTRILSSSAGLQPEIICVDNGSEKESGFSDDFLQKIVLIEETNYLRSPYSARNRGIEQASGDVIVFIDANSAPSDGWLGNGLRCLQESGSDIVAGHVGFDFNGEPDAAGVADAITSIHQKKSVEERGAAFTANLFVKRLVFDSTGLFEEGVRSGGDVRWTKKASEAGFKITFCSDSVVLKKARSFRELLRKRVRTGKGYLYTWQNEEAHNVWFYNFLRSLKPPAFRKPDELYRNRYGRPLPAGSMGVWAVLYLMGIVEQLSFMTEYLRYNLGGGRDEKRQKELENSDSAG
jgi:glycosyltransferase involved in cell wall biosynthesis